KEVLGSPLADALISPLTQHLAKVRALHSSDLQRGFGQAVLPRAYFLKSKNSSRQFRWQFVFPASKVFFDPRTGNSGRWHLNPRVLQRAVAVAADLAGIHK